MPGLTIAWEYLTGYAVATDPSTRERAEWPPHPARVFMALAAAWFETGEDQAEGDALRWLEGLGEPELLLPPLELVTERSAVTVYVPVNDRAGPSAATLHSAPAMTRSRQPRGFPKCFVGDQICFMRWPEADDQASHREALESLCAKVTRIGHSSSLVRMWVDDSAEDLGSGAHHELRQFVADPLGGVFRARKITPGFLDSLADQYGAQARERHAALQSKIEELQAERKTLKGKGARERKAAIDAELEPCEKELAGLIVRDPVRPRIGLWQGYRAADQQEVIVARSHFDHDMLVLVHAKDEHPLALASTLAVTQALRETILSMVEQPVPSWVSGHHADGSPNTSDEGHMAFVPMSFVDDRQTHANGALFGMGIVFPRAVSRSDRARVLAPLLIDANGEAKLVRLKLGRLGTWTLVRNAGDDRRASIEVLNWTGNPEKGARAWASATPVVLDRFPKTDRLKDRAAWDEEVAAIIRASCVRIGLPEPSVVGIRTTSWLHGSLRSTTKQRRLRGQADGPNTTALGDGFPMYPTKGGSGPRPQVHVGLRFDQPVLGPVLLGAGRYRGYGALKPMRDDAGGER